MKYFNEGIEKRLTLPKFPRSEDEMSFIRDKIATRTAEDVTSIRNHDEEPFYAIRQYCEKNDISFDKEKMMELMGESAKIITNIKDSFNRIRPFELDKKLNTLPSKTNTTRSYPSGHSTQARLVARIVARDNKKHEIELLKAGDECGMGRIKAGFHYLSDHEAGKLLGEKLFAFVKNI